MSMIAVVYLLGILGVALLGFLCNAVAYQLEKRAGRRQPPRS